MIERFAKLIETETTQVLFYTEYDDEKNETVLHQILSVDGVRADVALRFDGDNQEDKANAALSKQDDRSALKLIELVRGFLEVDEPGAATQ